MYNIEDIKNMEELFRKTQDVREVDVSFLGNKYTIIQVITLLSYIRNAIKNNKKCKIEVNIGNNVSNRDFEFLVNDVNVDDLITKDSIEIN
jgi:hypothetical protein